MFLYYLVPLFLLFILYLILKKIWLTKLNHLICDSDMNAVRTFIKQKSTRILLTTYVRDLYRTKSYLNEQNYDEVKKQLSTMFQKEYEKHANEQYLTLYFHVFILRNDMNFAKELLERIKQENEISFTKYSEWTIAVLCEQSTSLCKDMEEAIDNKEFSGFPLGVVAYLLGLQYERLENDKMAYEWYYNAQTVLQPTDLYRSIVDQKVAQYQIVEEDTE